MLIGNWQKTLENKLDIYKNLEINIKIYRNYKIKLEIYKNLQIKFEMYSYFKLENKLKIFEFFVNGRWSQYKCHYVAIYFATWCNEPMELWIFL